MPNINLEINNNTHWSISFEVKLDKDKAQIEDTDLLAGLEATDFWLEDEVIVAGTADATPSIEQVKNYVLNTEVYDDEYPLPAVDFRLTGIELLSVAEI